VTGADTGAAGTAHFEPGGVAFWDQCPKPKNGGPEWGFLGIPPGAGTCTRRSDRAHMNDSAQHASFLKKMAPARGMPGPSRVDCVGLVSQPRFRCDRRPAFHRSTAAQPVAISRI
jgi:hypothetical protein